MTDDDRTIARPQDRDATLAQPGDGGDDAECTLVTPPPGADPESQDPPAAGDGTRPPGVPERIGPYRLKRLVGEGGMGQVFEAEQMEPVRRSVALKIIKRGMDTEEFVARFESERQALAVMDHPCISTVHDAGATERGRPYFVMEFVDGVPISNYCDERRLAVRERLELFVRVCEGVQHAHQKAIIHRDLKPGNVLVTEYDGQPVPKIIDFGVAKATDRDLTDNTMKTGVGQIVGTPAYMSPEQADLDGRHLDTRTDVYALGVILYELLAGELPFPRAELQDAGFQEALRKIREDDPPRPSDRFGTLASGQGDVAHARAMDKAGLRRKLRGELDWIVMKALEKDIARRYTTVHGLAVDIRRYLKHEPVSAGPPSRVYRLKKYVRRNRVGVATGTLVLLALVLGAIGTSIGLVRARRAEALATEEAITATRVTDFLVDIFEVSDPDRARGETITAREVLDQGADRVAVELADQPRTRARLSTTVGKVYRNLGLWKEAGPFLESAVELRRAGAAEEVDLAVSLTELADQRLVLGRYDEAAALLEEALEIFARHDHPDPAELAGSLHELGSVYRRQGRYEEALPLYRRARSIRVQAYGSDDPVVARSDNSLAVLAWNMGDYEEAERRYLQALQVWQDVYGDDHADVAKVRNNLGLLFHQLGRYDEAEDLHRGAAAIYEKILGPDHPRLANSENNLALALFELERWDEAELHYRRALAIRERVHGRQHPHVATTLNNLGNLALRRGDFAESERLFQDALELRIATLGADHPDVAWSLRDLGVMLDERGDPAASLPYFERAVATFAAANGTDHPQLAEIYDDYGEALAHAGQTERAASIAAAAAAIRSLEGS